MRKRLLFLFIVACGSRTGLLVDEAYQTPDASVPHDATIDVTGRDVQVSDVVPPIDVVVADVITPLDCADAAITYIYLFSSANDLLSFEPSTLKVNTIGKVSCPTPLQPNSMAVDHLGVAYANLTDFVVPDAGGIFKLSTSTAACSTTSYAPQFGFTQFGMGFVSDLDGGENLFIADTRNNPSGALASVDVSTFKLGYVAPFSPPLPRCELTGTGDGRLFAFCVTKTGGTLAQVDPKTAKQIGADTLKTGAAANSFAYAFWGGNFFLFTSPGGGSTVTEYDPVKKTETVVKTLTQEIVGAGVSTCAPL
jgi:hypothetical protein